MRDETVAAFGSRSEPPRRARAALDAYDEMRDEACAVASLLASAGNVALPDNVSAALDRYRAARRRWRDLTARSSL